MGLSAACNYAHGRPDEGETDYRGFSRLRGQLELGVDVNLPLEWKGRISGHGYYDAVYAIKAAFEALKITGDPAKRVVERTKISDFFFNSQEFDGVQGNFRWVNGKNMAPFHFFQIRDNKIGKIRVLKGE